LANLGSFASRSDWSCVRAGGGIHPDRVAWLRVSVWGSGLAALDPRRDRQQTHSPRPQPLQHDPGEAGELTISTARPSNRRWRRSRGLRGAALHRKPSARRHSGETAAPGVGGRRTRRAVPAAGRCRMCGRSPAARWRGRRAFRGTARVGVSGAASEQECLVAEPLGFVAMSSAVIESRSSRSGQRRGDARDRRNLSVRTTWSIPIHLRLAPVVSVTSSMRSGVRCGSND
jgi:hypothetical protein